MFRKVFLRISGRNFTEPLKHKKKVSELCVSFFLEYVVLPCYIRPVTTRRLILLLILTLATSVLPASLRPTEAKAELLRQSSDRGGPWSAANLFGRWGDRNVFYLDGRAISMVARSERTFEGSPPGAVMTAQLGIYDITNTNDVYGRRFLINCRDATFTLDDTSSNPTAREYRLRIDPNGNIDFRRVRGDNDFEFPGGVGSIPTLRDVFQMRADRVLNSNSTVRIAGQTYYPTNESSDRQYWQLWSQRTVDRLREGRSTGVYIEADHIAYVSERGPDGRLLRARGPVKLGQIGGVWYDLAWNDQEEIWVPVAGAPPSATNRRGSVFRC